MKIDFRGEMLLQDALCPLLHFVCYAYVCDCVCVRTTGSAGPGLPCARGRYCPAGSLEEVICPRGTFTPHQGAISEFIRRIITVLYLPLIKVVFHIHSQ